MMMKVRGVSVLPWKLLLWKLMCCFILCTPSASFSVVTTRGRASSRVLWPHHASPTANNPETVMTETGQIFWSQSRSEKEIKDHVLSCLAPFHHPDDAPLEVEVRSVDPPLLLIHNFAPPQVCKSIITSALEQTMQRSTVGSDQTVRTHRTSSTVWLKENDETSDDKAETTQSLYLQYTLRFMADQVAALSGLPPSHMENLQVVRYEPGQEFQLHTDHQDSFNDLECRGRLATCLLYLCKPEEGGETFFPGIDSPTGGIVDPRPGTAVFFWNTVQRPGSPGYDPLMFLDTDKRMRHAGWPVKAGQKWIANRWIHPIDFGSGVRGL